MEWILVAVAFGLIALLMCGLIDEVAYWWSLRRTDPRRVAPARPARRAIHS